MPIFKRKEKKPGYDAERVVPVIRCSICTGEQVAGFKDKATGQFSEVMLICSDRDLEMFREKYGITGKIGKVY